MVERHVGDDGEAEVEDVGRVEPAAHADLDHQPVATWRQEGEGHRGEDLELGRGTELGADPFQPRLQPLHGGRELGLRDGLAVDLDALRVGGEVGAGHGPHRVTAMTEDRRQHRCRGSLAVGAGDKRASQSGLWVTGKIEDGSRSFEAELDALGD